MNYAGLSLDDAPSLSVPLRFLLSAPPFGVAAALLLIWFGPQALASRWSPATLAAAHLMTLGYLTMVMAGAVLQLLPVLAGTRIPYARTVSAGVHVLLCAAVNAPTFDVLTIPNAQQQRTIELLRQIKV
ncbi:MAG: hypothetical protein B7Z66_11620 [Chromatiales bacterium 21-64-14]|nr:MAG: hypothetical protein B7Z66_11620 [Chromatiales bacterium 21-64-14]